MKCGDLASVVVQNTKKTLVFCATHWAQKKKSFQNGHGYKVVKCLSPLTKEKEHG